MSQDSLGLLAGLSCIPRALRLLRAERELWPLCGLPLALNLLAFALGIWLFFAYLLDPASAAAESLLALREPSAWYAWLWVGPLWLLSWLARWVLIAVFAVVSYFLFTAVGAVLASPFLDALSRRVERITMRAELQPAVGGIGAALRVVREEGKRVLCLLLVQLGFVLLGLVPGLQPLALGGSLLFAALFLSLDYTGYLLDRRAISFRARRRWLWQHRRPLLGFGTTALGTLFVPGLNFLSLPVLVTAGTLLALDLGVPSAGATARSES